MAKPSLTQHAKGFLQHVVPAVLKPLRVLWNEIIGFLFIVLAIVPIRQAYQAWQRGEPVLLLHAAWILTMAYFGVASFRRARKITRS